MCVHACKWAHGESGPAPSPHQSSAGVGPAPLWLDAGCQLPLEQRPGSHIDCAAYCHCGAQPSGGRTNEHLVVRRTSPLRTHPCKYPSSQSHTNIRGSPVAVPGIGIYLTVPCWPVAVPRIGVYPCWPVAVPGIGIYLTVPCWPVAVPGIGVYPCWPVAVPGISVYLTVPCSPVTMTGIGV